MIVLKDYSGFQVISFLASVGLEDSYLKKLPVALKAAVTDNKILFTLGDNTTSVIVKYSAVKLAQNGKLGPASKNLIINQIKSALNGLYGVKTSEPESGTTTGHVSAAVKTNPEKQEEEKSKPEKPTTMKDGLPNVINATQLLQKVKGQSNGSVYFYVGSYNKGKIKVAARWNQKGLSVRVEFIDNNQYHSYHNRFLVAGLAGKKGYVSEHFVVDSDLLAKRTFAAIMGGVDLQPDFVFPQLDLIKNKGH